ncbi:MAG TPA: flagellar filament capping protein FliD [Baekduia sp.]|uniref:flagellar filament capping protein FliD n=1 Tax=Baekduia sp. TaxID=2600305 RepID=UPI002C8343A1|nr:flagellar filament capping protein FliD [Baekduia sp.]HMJ37909.1 flagellar filament capping protein FliD [Baekduia sp.]
MAGIQLSGLVSGLDTASIIDQLMSIERTPRTKITLDQSATTKRQSLLQDISTKLTALKTANDDLKSSLTWLDTQSVESGDSTKLTITRTGGAPPGGYDVSITQLATAERATYDWQDLAADGPLQILNKDGTPRASIDLKAGATVDDAVAAINASTDTNVYAVNVNGDLVLAAKSTGDGSGFSVTGAGAETERVAGLNAKLTINGATVERQTNTITDALPGVTLTLKGKTSGTNTIGVTVGTPGPDKDAITQKAQSFITAYNALVTATRADLDEKRVPGATTSTDIQRGTLFGDSGLSSMLTSFRSAISAPIAGLTGLTSLADLGISTGAANTGTTVNQDAVDGKLTLDTAKLSAALDSNPLGVRKLLGGLSGTDGFSQAFSAVIAPLQGTGGILDSRITAATKDLSDIKDRLDTFDARMDTKQAMYQKQFTALETALQKSQTVGTSLASYISSMSA